MKLLISIVLFFILKEITKISNLFKKKRKNLRGVNFSFAFVQE